MRALSTGAKPLTSIVIVNFNGGPMLADCVESVRRHTKNYELFLIDNCSSDNSLQLVRKDPGVHIIKLCRNIGFARANNIGIGTSSGRYVVLLNSDTTVTPFWLDRLISKAESSPSIGLVAPKLLLASKPTILDSTGHIYQFEMGWSIDRGHGQIDKGQYDSSTELPSCCFACTLIKRKVFERIGLLDEAMFFSYEDVDFGLRARIAGWRVLYCPSSVVYHARHGSIPTGQKKRIRNLSRPYPLRIMLKNYQSVNMLRYAGRRFLLDVLRVAAGIKNFDFDYANGYASEVLWNLVHFPLRERIVNRKLRKIQDASLITRATELANK